jgi:hypothetical protein
MHSSRLGHRHDRLWQDVNWCRRDPPTRSFCSRLDALYDDALQDAERLHGQAAAAGSRLPVGEDHRPAFVTEKTLSGLGLTRLERGLGGEAAATAYLAELRAVTMDTPPTAGARTSGNRHEPREPTRRSSAETWERWRLANVVVAVTLAAGTVLSGLWSDSPAFPEAQVLATNTGSAAAIAPARSLASDPPSTSNDGPRKPAPARESATPAVANVYSAPLESGPPVAARVTPPAAKITPRPKKALAKQPRARTSGEPPRKTATLTIAVSPWGAIYIDGKLRGTTPPITTLDLSPGRHLVEVRNASEPAYVTYATVQAGEVRTIRHEFETRHGFH